MAFAVKSADGSEAGRFPTSSGDGIVLHQVLQWHHMLSSAGYPPDTLANLEFNVL